MGTAGTSGREVADGHPERDTGDARWIDFPPRWPERPEPGRSGADHERERPPVTVTGSIPLTGRRERTRVLRIVTGARPPRRA